MKTEAEAAAAVGDAAAAAEDVLGWSWSCTASGRVSAAGWRAVGSASYRAARFAIWLLASPGA